VKTIPIPALEDVYTAYQQGEEVVLALLPGEQKPGTLYMPGFIVSQSPE